MEEARRIFDVSMTIHPGMLTWPGNPPLVLERVKDIGKGDSSNVSFLQMGTHTATHVDAPRHFLPQGASVDAIDPARFVGPARLFQLGDISSVTRDILADLDLQGIKRVLLGTRNSSLLDRPSFTSDFAFISADAAHYLVELEIDLVGLDYLSVEEYQKEGRPTHHALLEAGVIVIEGLDLDAVPPGEYEIICLPLKLKGADGAPARVLLREL